MTNGIKSEKRRVNQNKGRLNIFAQRFKRKSIGRKYYSVLWDVEVIDLIRSYVEKHPKSARSFSEFLEISGLVLYEILEQHPNWTARDLARCYVEQIPLTITLNRPDLDTESESLDFTFHGKSLGATAYDGYCLKMSIREPKRWDELTEEEKTAWDHVAKISRK